MVVKEQQRDPVRGALIHLDLLEVKLDEEIEAEVPIELLGAENAPGVKEGGVLEHVTHQITIEALPTAIPESIPADVSGMSIGDTLQLSALIAPEGVEFAVDDPDEVTIATLSPPRVEEEPEPELEEEAELVGEEGEVPEGEEAAEGGRPRRRARPRPRAASPAEGTSRCRFCAGCVAAERGEARGLGGHRAGAGRGPRQPGLALRGHPPQPRLRGGGRAHPPLGDAAGRRSGFAA